MYNIVAVGYSCIVLEYGENRSINIPSIADIGEVCEVGIIVEDMNDDLIYAMTEIFGC